MPTTIKVIAMAKTASVKKAARSKLSPDAGSRQYVSDADATAAIVDTAAYRRGGLPAPLQQRSRKPGR